MRTNKNRNIQGTLGNIDSGNASDAGADGELGVEMEVKEHESELDSFLADGDFRIIILTCKFVRRMRVE